MGVELVDESAEYQELSAAKFLSSFHAARTDASCLYQIARLYCVVKVALVSASAWAGAVCCAKM